MNTDLPPTHAPTRTTHREPLVNLPPLTFGLLLGFTAIHLMRAFWPAASYYLVNLLGFMPIAFTADPVSQSYTLIGYGVLHFGWLHFFMNMTGWMAFGSGIERLYGKKWLLILLGGGTVAGALGHWVLEPDSIVLLGGASAGISALFGAIIPVITHGRRNYWTAIIVFIVMNVAIGMIGMPNEPGLAIAWQAHIVGFVFGLITIRFNKTHPHITDAVTPSVAD